ncbi:hypothetical protein P171DRAFT_484816 [Karstenula rhodostoma CBS 690.94]|uniref:Uncharacterized protein n=1 Tax=Karstenula rhodostoma CBS 690.94 TaxID=1392251 RepID=A0A9P4PK90_9PLEO|nr:hypothetical protein P171DRAFT_484816 [Karstenula rhodostoma CBS 690.94]
MSSPENYTFDAFVELLQQGDARELLLELVEDPNFMGLNVAPRTPVPVSQNLTAATNPTPTNAASAPPAQAPANPVPTPLAQATPTMPTAAPPLREEDELPEDISPSPSPASSDSSNDVVWNNWENKHVPKYEKDPAQHPLIPLDQSFTSLPYSAAISYEQHKIRKENRAREKAERKEREKNDRERPIFEWLLKVDSEKEENPEIPDLASIQEPRCETEALDTLLKGNRKRKDRADPEEAVEKSMPPSKRRSTSPEEVPEDEQKGKDRVPVEENSNEDQTSGKGRSIYMDMILENERKRKDMDDPKEDADESSQRPKKKPKQVSFAETPAEVRIIPEEDVTVEPEAEPEYSDDEREDAEPRRQPSLDATQDAPALSDTPSGPAHGAPSSPQVPQQPWQPPPEVEDLRLHPGSNNTYGRFPALDLYPPRRKLAAVPPIRTEPYVFGGVRQSNPLKRKAKGEPKGAGVRRSKRLQKAATPEDEDSAAPDGGQVAPERAAPDQEPLTEPLVTIRRRGGTRPRLIANIKVRPANLSRLVR